MARPHRHCALIGAGAIAALLGSGIAIAQVSAPSSDDLDLVPPQFQDLVRGRSDKINQQANRRPPPAAAPAALPNPSKDPHDLRGYWVVSRGAGGPPGQAPQAEPGEAAPLAIGNLNPDARLGTDVDVIPDGNRICLVTPGVLPATMKVYQDKDVLTFVFDNELRARRIYLNAKHPAKPTPSYNGDSVGHWEGDTLVVDTVGLKGAWGKTRYDLETGSKGVLLVPPTTHVVERISRNADGTGLTDAISFLDLKPGQAPLTTTIGYRFAKDAFVFESECEDGGDLYGPKSNS